MKNHIITLDDAIHAELKEHPELKADYERELFINARLERGDHTRMPSLGLFTKLATAAHAQLKIHFEMEE